ncbi:LVIVD repeat protein [Planctomycetes bacterium Poly30]|uniref:LVIVD repeat protein n=1 Tax=Saltatorellus ferox TaxID=2528018 RepID=A0A518EWX2_9BACT|nr:LVIVD repeat protein [Planctomycetes bacterium Poly30]
MTASPTHRSSGRTALRYSLALTGLGLTFAASAVAHEDDPKILDRKPPVAGSGFQAGVPMGALLPGGGANTAASSGFPASGVQLESWLTLGDLGNGNDNGNDCWGYVSPSGREYALMGTTSATVVVEITNPGAPVVIQRIPGPSSTWRDIKTYQDRAYTVSEGGNGIQVINLSNVDNGVVSLETTITGNGTDASHNVAIDEDSGFLYRSGGGSNGLRIYSLANPGNPVFVGQWNTRYVHDVQVVTYTTGAFAGREIAYCCAGLNGGFQDTGLTVVDVTNKANPVVLSQIAYPSREYSHQGWLSEDRTRFYLGDELDEGNSVSLTTTHIFDVSDPANATYIGQFDNGDPAIGHNMYSHDGKLFQANYTSGLRVFDLANLDNPTEMAYFDTAPTSTSASFNGLWSCYPYFPSGVVIGSDIESGLFVWTVEEPELEVQLVAAAPELIDPSGASVDVTITELLPGALDPSSPVLVYDIGAGATSVALASNGGTSYTANFPALPCGTAVNWYIQAGSMSGQTATAPEGAPTTTFAGLIGDQLIVARSDDMETTAGWVGGAAGDTATTGIWTRGNPIGTGAQPEDDHTPSGTSCWFTGQGGAGGGLGDNDVDGGTTTLLTPVIDMASLDAPIVSYFRWYSNDQGGAPNADVFRVEISNNGGSSWTLVEQVGPSGAGTSGGWIEHSFEVSSLVTPTSQMRMRFIASDLGTGSIVEAAIDDFKVTDIACGDGIGSLYCDANQNSAGRVGLIIGSGSNVVANNNLSLLAIDLPPNVNGYFVVSPNQAFVQNPAGSQGNLCVGSSTGRYINQIGNSGLFGEIPVVIDATSIPQPTGAIAVAPGDTLNFQLWHRDANPGVTSNFTRGYSVTFQ